MTITADRRAPRPLARAVRRAVRAAGRLAARVAQRLFVAAVDRLDVTVLVGDRVLGTGGPVAVVHRPDEFFARLGRDQLIGFGEAYLTGAWDAEDLGGVPRRTRGGPARPGAGPAAAAAVPRGRAATAPPARQRRDTQDNIAHHYDLSNDLFELFLDPSLSYSSALFADDPSAATRTDLEAAQYRKIDRLLDQAGVGGGTRLLEIGTGWGELAIRAARRGATVHTITLSVEQQRLARQRIAAAGVADRVDVELCDYRSVTGRYDAVVSVEMIEAVGWRYWRTYFETIDRLLRPAAGPPSRRSRCRTTGCWPPGTPTPGSTSTSSPAASCRRCGRSTRSPAATRRCGSATGWRSGSTTPRPCGCGTGRSGPSEADVRGLGFDETFLRMWHFYLEYSRAGFASGYLDVHQLTFTKTGEPT